jgi:hypothetical protein
MKITKIVTITAGLLLVAGAAKAAEESWWTTHFVSDMTTPRYRPHEFSLDLFGSYQAPEEKFSRLFRTDIRSTGIWGGGVGLNYFLTPIVGIGADSNFGDNRGAFVDHVVGSLFLRLPLGASGVAPYIYGGGGRGIDPAWQWLGHAGVGLEYRFNPATGIFMDGRYIWAEKSGYSDSLLLRAGLRIVF